MSVCKWGCDAAACVAGGVRAGKVLCMHASRAGKMQNCGKGRMGRCKGEGVLG